jgi:hypothetical protein
MAETRDKGPTNKSKNSARRPKGFSPGASGPSGENAREQGWQLNEEERTRTAKSMQGKTGGRDYDYGAQDFGDTPRDTSSANGQSSPAHSKQPMPKVSSNQRERARQ